MKKILFIVLSLLMVLVFSACETEGSVSSSDSTESSESTVSSVPEPELSGVFFKYEPVADPKPVTKENSTYSAMQFNVEASDICGTNASLRITALEDIITALDPDLISFNECCGQWDSEFRESKIISENYTLVTRATYDKVLFRTERFTVERQEYVMIGSGRGMEYAILHDNVTAKRFCVISTHWNHSSSYTIEAAEKRREENAEKTVAYLKVLEKTYPDAAFIMMGDFNCLNPKDQQKYNEKMFEYCGRDEKVAAEYYGNTALKILEEKTKYRSGAALVKNPENAEPEKSLGYSVDHIYFDPERFSVLSYNYSPTDGMKIRKDESVKRTNGVSDHDPVFSEFILNF